MMQNLLLDEGDFLSIESASLPVATFSKFQPQSVDFLDISNPKAVLENALRNFACLTTGFVLQHSINLALVVLQSSSHVSDMVAITYNDRVYELKVLETKPGNAVSIIECDMNVEFAPPVGYTEPQRPQKAKQDEEDEMDTFDPATYVQEPQGFVPFGGAGVR